MQIDLDNNEIGNRAMGAVLLMYFHMVSEGGITNDQTVYSESIDVRLSELLDAFCEYEDNHEVSSKLIREGAAISLICDLDDQISNYPDDYLLQPSTQRIIKKLETRTATDVPEVNQVLDLVSKKHNFEYKDYRDLLDRIYRNYVLGYWNKVAQGNAFA